MDSFLVKAILEYLDFVSLCKVCQVCHCWETIIKNDILNKRNIELFWRKNALKLLQNFRFHNYHPTCLLIDEYTLIEFGIKIKFFDCIQNKNLGRVINVHFVDFLNRYHHYKSFRFTIKKKIIDTYLVEYDHIKKIVKIQVSTFKSYLNLDTFCFFQHFNKDVDFCPTHQHTSTIQNSWKVINGFWVNANLLPQFEKFSSQTLFLGKISKHSYWMCGKKIPHFISPCYQFALTTVMPFKFFIQQIIPFHNTNKLWIIVAQKNNKNLYSRFLLKLENQEFHITKIAHFYRHCKLYPVYNSSKNSIMFYNDKFQLCATISC